MGVGIFDITWFDICSSWTILTGIVQSIRRITALHGWRAHTDQAAFEAASWKGTILKGISSSNHQFSGANCQFSGSLNYFFPGVFVGAISVSKTSPQLWSPFIDIAFQPQWLSKHWKFIRGQTRSFPPLGLGVFVSHYAILKKKLLFPLVHEDP